MGNEQETAEPTKASERQKEDYMDVNTKNAVNQRNNAAYWYSQDDLTIIAQTLPYAQNITVTNINGLKSEYNGGRSQIKDLMSLDEKGTPKFCILNINDNHWTLLTIAPSFRKTESGKNSAIVYYKDSFGNKIPKELEKLIKKTHKELGLGEVKTFSNSDQQQSPGTNDCGPFVLMNLQTMASSLAQKPEEYKFSDQKFCSAKEAQKYRMQDGPKAYIQAVSNQEDFKNLSKEKKIGALEKFLHIDRSNDRASLNFLRSAINSDLKGIRKLAVNWMHSFKNLNLFSRHPVRANSLGAEKNAENGIPPIESLGENIDKNNERLTSSSSSNRFIMGSPKKLMDGPKQLIERSLKNRGTVLLKAHAHASSGEGPNIDHTPPPQELGANEIIRRLNEPSKGKRLPSGFKSLF
ncbi:Ulp1 family isopeptidase, partial [Allomuricauda taeanensis]|uniref:Ulp1 family isopeptidase n=1 Tax=Flagellimonas taeanensis TaxID=1005926 RepID=UPI002E7B1010